MAHTIESIDKEIQQLEEKKQELLRKKSELNSLTPSQRIANILHSKQCHWNGCGWEYSSWCDPCNTRLDYLKKAQAMLREVDFDTAIKVLNLS
jgi:hypothetical protein